MSHNFKVIKSASLHDDTELPTLIPNGNIWPLMEKIIKKTQILTCLSESSDLENMEEKDRLVLASLKKVTKKQRTQHSSPVNKRIITMNTMSQEDLIHFIKEEHKCNRLLIKEEALKKFVNYLIEEEFSGPSLMFIKEEDLKQLLLNELHFKLGCTLTICAFVSSLKQLKN